MIQIVLNLTQGCFRDFDVARLPLVLTKLPEGSHVIHSMAEWVVVLVHQAKALRRTKAKKNIRRDGCTRHDNRDGSSRF